MPVEPVLETGESPFAVEIKEVVLRNLVEKLDERLGPGYVYILDDAAHGDELVRRLRGGALEVTNRIVIAMQDGAVVTYETQQPAVMCALEVSAWTADDAQVAGIWYASDKLEGREAFHVVWESPRWTILDNGKER